MSILYNNRFTNAIYNYMYGVKQVDTPKPYIVNIAKDLSQDEQSFLNKIIRESYVKSYDDEDSTQVIAFESLKVYCSDIAEKLLNEVVVSEEDKKYNHVRRIMFLNILNVLCKRELIDDNISRDILINEYYRFALLCESLKTCDYIQSKIPLWIILQIDMCLRKKYNSKIYFANIDKLL